MAKIITITRRAIPVDEAQPPDLAVYLSVVDQTRADWPSWWQSHEWHRNVPVWRVLETSDSFAGCSCCEVLCSGPWRSEAPRRDVSHRRRQPAAAAHCQAASLPTDHAHAPLWNHSVPGHRHQPYLMLRIIVTVINLKKQSLQKTVIADIVTHLKSENMPFS